MESHHVKLVDTHVHLNLLSDPGKVIERARTAGVTNVIAVGMDHDSNSKNLVFSNTYRGCVYPALGIHPWEAKEDLTVEMKYIKEKIDHCVALGEIGLDYWIKRDPQVQRKIFMDLLTLATERDKPVCVHSRGAWEDAYNCVNSSGVKRAVFHWYSGPLEVLQRIIDDGYFISATPAASYSKHLRSAISRAPIDRILLETDSPVKYGGVPAEPAHLLKTLKHVAEIKGVSETFLAEKTTENAYELFKFS